MINKILKNKWKILAVILSILIIVFETWYFSRWLIRFKFRITTAVSFVILVFMFLKILIGYFSEIFKEIKNKKIIKSVFMALLIIFAILGLWFVKEYVNYIIRNTVLMIIYILGVICIPMIVLCYCILKDIKYKKIKILITFISIIFIYVTHAPLLISSARQIVVNISNAPKSIFEIPNEEKINIEYLENYEQKFSSQGYLSKYDIQQIIDLTDKKSKEMKIYYTDEMLNINMEISNKSDEQIEEIKQVLESNYYKFRYTKDKKQNVEIFINRYVIEKQTGPTEKNEDIIISGTKNKDIIENIDKYGTEEFASSFLFKNKVNVENEILDNSLKSFKILLAYDEEIENYLPVIEDKKEYSKIEEYKVYSYGINLTLKENVKLENKDYTLRINRYNANLEFIDKKIINNGYYYEYEPIVTELTNSKGNTVLEINFDRNYYRQEIKNIEIIFGK